MKRNRKRKFWSSAWQSVVCIVLAVVLFYVYYKTHTINENPLIVLGIVIGFYLILTAFVLWAGQSAQNPRKKEHTPVTFSANDCTTLTQKVSVPMVLCNENGLIIWANEAFNQISDISPLTNCTVLIEAELKNNPLTAVFPPLPSQSFPGTFTKRRLLKKRR